MEGNLAPALCDEPRTELIAGKVTAMSPRPALNHNSIIFNLSRIFGNYLLGKTCRPFGDGADLYLTKKDHFIPDFMIVCDKNKMKHTYYVEGAPDFVVEVLSPGTAHRDRGYKKSAYERSGVREYWIIDPVGRSVEQHVLEDGAFTLRDVYYHYRPYELEEMTKEEKAEVVTEIRCALFDDLSVSLSDLFYYVSD